MNVSLSYAASGDGRGLRILYHAAEDEALCPLARALYSLLLLGHAEAPAPQSGRDVPRWVDGWVGAG